MKTPRSQVVQDNPFGDAISTTSDEDSSSSSSSSSSNEEKRKRKVVDTNNTSSSDFEENEDDVEEETLLNMRQVSLGSTMSISNPPQQGGLVSPVSSVASKVSFGTHLSPPSSSSSAIRRIGVIGGSGLLESSLFTTFTKFVTPIHRVFVLISDNIVFVQRHKYHLDEVTRQVTYVPPHAIDYVRIWRALKEELNVQMVLGICSVGSLKPELYPVGQFVVPSDYVALDTRTSNVFSDERMHYAPEVNANVRSVIVAAMKYVKGDDLDRASHNESVMDGVESVYVQTNGPRFETKAEIRFLQTLGDVVGMTGANEANVACELKIPYAMLCMVDNLANGLSEKREDNVVTDMAQFKKAQAMNLKKTEMALVRILDFLSKSYNGTPPQTTSGRGGVVDIGPGQIKTLLLPRFIATVNEDDLIIENGAVAIGGNGKILHIYPHQNVREILKHNNKTDEARMEVIHLKDSVLLPGLINAHTHAPMSFLRGIGDDLKLTDWLTKRVWPVEGKVVSQQFVEDSSRAAIHEMLCGGITCFNDMYFFPESTVKAAREAGVRAHVGLAIIGFPTVQASGSAECLQQAKEILRKNNNENDLIKFTISPHAPYTVEEEYMVEAKKLAKTHGLVYHTHLHECEEEIIASVNHQVSSSFCHRSSRACRPLENLKKLGVLDEGNCVFAHMCHVSEEDLQTLKQYKCSVVHCPTSNLKLASGISPITKFIELGINVALGTDGCSSNNSLDLFGEMKLAALLAKGINKDASAITARTVIRMATINGAKALGMDDLIGSIEVGKCADLIAVDLFNKPFSRPVYDPIDTIVFSCGRENIHSVWINGELKVNKSEPNKNAVRVPENAWNEKKEAQICEDWAMKIIQILNNQ